MATMLRVEESTHEEIMRIARDDYSGASVDETVRRLAREHAKQRADDDEAALLGKLRDSGESVYPDLDGWVQPADFGDVDN